MTNAFIAFMNRKAGGACFAPTASVVICVAQQEASEEKKKEIKDQLTIKFFGQDNKKEESLEKKKNDNDLFEEVLTEIMKDEKVRAAGGRLYDEYSGKLENEVELKSVEEGQGSARNNVVVLLGHAELGLWRRVR